MSLQNISVLGYTDQQTQFVIKSKELHLKTGQKTSTEPNYQPLEYVLAGIAACINAVGKQVAEELNFHLKSLQIEIIGQYETKKTEGIKTRSRAGFKSIAIEIKPNTDASLTEIKLWMDEIKERCPVYDTLLNATPIELKVTKEFDIRPQVDKKDSNAA